MNRSILHLLDLSDEMLLYIFEKLDNVNILYSLFGINNQRLEYLCQEEKFCNTLDLFSITSKSIVIDLILNRFCNDILPKINDKVKCFIVESAYLERILLAGSYSNLIELKLNFKRDDSLHHFTDDSPLRNVLKQVKKLFLIVDDHNKTIKFWRTYTEEVYAHILIYCENLEHFTIKYSLGPHPLFLFSNLSLNTFSSSSLTHLNVNVLHFTDCLHLFDGRLKQLNTCIINVCFMDDDLSNVRNFVSKFLLILRSKKIIVCFQQDDLPNMKYFSFTYYSLIENYDNRIHSLVHRMLNLEKLTLYLRFKCYLMFVDPISVLKQFTLCNSQLQSFNYYLSTENDSNDINRYLSNHNMERNPLNIGHYQVLNFTHFLYSTATYHIFTVPFQFLKLYHINNNILPNIIFKNVIELWISDIVLFEHDFILRIAQNFPSLEILNVCNFLISLSNGKKSSYNSQSYQIAGYNHLKFLDVRNADIDSVELLLNEAKTCLPCLNELRIKYEHLRIVTRDFTREETRRNCVNVNRLVTYTQMVGSKEFYTYFPLL